MAYPFRSGVADARPAPVSDRVLGHLTRIAHDAPNSLATEAECEWLLSSIGPLLDELGQRRAVMAGLNLRLPANVVTLPGARA